MIRIHADVERMQLRVRGHAGYAPEGQDIVCAAVSALVYTLAQNLALTLCDEDYTAQLEDGDAYIEARPPAELADGCQRIFMVIVNGLNLLANQYGQYVWLEAVALLPAASATSPPESYGFQGGAAGACAQAQRLRCVTCNENLRFSLRIGKLRIAENLTIFQ